MLWKNFPETFTVWKWGSLFSSEEIDKKTPHIKILWDIWWINSKNMFRIWKYETLYCNNRTLKLLNEDQNWPFLAENICGFSAWRGLNSEVLIQTRYSRSLRLTFEPRMISKCRVPLNIKHIIISKHFFGRGNCFSMSKCELIPINFWRVSIRCMNYAIFSIVLIYAKYSMYKSLSCILLIYAR